MHTITIINTFHNTEARLFVGEKSVGGDYEISRSQYYRARRKLCGMSDCGCGAIWGDPNHFGLYKEDEGWRARFWVLVKEKHDG